MRSLVIGASLALALTVASCSSDDSKTTATTPTSVNLSPTTNTPLASTTAPATTAATAPSTSSEATSAPVGVTPTDLTDGTLYWGYLADYKAGPPTTFTVDVAEVYFGKKAIAEATKDHAEGTIEPDIDPVIYVRNNNTKQRVVAVGAGVTGVIDGCYYGADTADGHVGGDCSLAKKVGLDKLPRSEGESGGQLVIFTLKGGVINRIEQPYFP
jgi:hypothetical protein